MELLIYFAVALTISAVGSIPPGLITLSILRRSVQINRKAALWVSAGALLPEFIYTYLALVGYRYLQQNHVVEERIQQLATAVFLLFGIYYLLKKKSTDLKLPEEGEVKENATDFGRGLGVGFLNMLIIPFWVIVAGWLGSYDFSFDNSALILSFCFGAAIGAGIVFWAYVELGNWLVQRLGRIDYYTNKAVGGIFLGLGILQLI
ncbi:MAG: LysE family transporter [Bacteroidota bacterium]